jgi:signal transduction histidine kinase
MRCLGGRRGFAATARPVHVRRVLARPSDLAILTCVSDDRRALRLLSLAAHELRTPANVIGGALRLLQVAGDERAPMREQALRQAERNYEHLVELLAEMSEVWRLESGEAVFNRQPVAVDAMLQAAVRAAAPRLAARGSAAAESAAVTGARVLADPTRLQRAFSGLFLAVARHLHEETHVCARAALPATMPGTVRIVFSDGSGPDPSGGIGPRTAIDEFESGLGFALPIARRVIQADGGTLEAVAGRPPAFVVELPLLSSEPASQ